MGGSDRKASLWTKEGVRLVTIAEREEWVWSCVPRPDANYVAVGCNDGTICMYQLIFATVHGLHRERYAYRDFMTDVVVQHMLSEQRLRIKCKDYVRKIAIYKDRLAVQLPNRLNIYDLPLEEGEMNLRPRERLLLAVDCNLLVLTAKHFLLCNEKKLQLYGFTGAREREWALDSVIRYLKVTGGPPGREGLAVGLEDGQVFRIFIDNPFPVKLVKHSVAVRCLDVSASRDKLAVVDDSSVVTVYDIKSGQARHRAAQPIFATARRPFAPCFRMPRPLVRSCRRAVWCRLCSRSRTRCRSRGTRSSTICCASRATGRSRSRRAPSRSTSSASRASWSASRAPRSSACTTWRCRLSTSRSRPRFTATSTRRISPPRTASRASA